MAPVALLCLSLSPGPGVAMDLVRLESGPVCLGWRPFGTHGAAFLAGGLCDRPAQFVGSPQRLKPVSGFDGAPVPATARTWVEGWTPLALGAPEHSSKKRGPVQVFSPSAWPASGTSGSPLGSCLTVHRQAGREDAGALTADILPCDPEALDQSFEVRRAPSGGFTFASRQPLENGEVCLTAPRRPGPPASFVPCRTDPAQVFTLGPAPMAAAPTRKVLQ